MSKDVTNLGLVRSKRLAAGTEGRKAGDRRAVEPVGGTRCTIDGLAMVAVCRGVWGRVCLCVLADTMCVGGGRRQKDEKTWSRADVDGVG